MIVFYRYLTSVKTIIEVNQRIAYDIVNQSKYKLILKQNLRDYWIFSPLIESKNILKDSIKSQNHNSNRIVRNLTYLERLIGIEMDSLNLDSGIDFKKVKITFIPF